MLALPLFRNRIVAGARMLPKPRRIARARSPTLLKKQRAWVTPYSFQLSAPKPLNLNPARTATSTPQHSERHSSPTTAKDEASPPYGKETQQAFEQFCELMWPKFVQGDELTLSQFWNNSSSHTQFGQLVPSGPQRLLKFSGRNNLISQMEDIVKERLIALESSSLDKQTTPIISTVGGPGLGKSRILDEVWNRVGETSAENGIQNTIKESIAFRVTFGNGTSLASSETNYSLALAARILFVRMNHVLRMQMDDAKQNGDLLEPVPVDPRRIDEEGDLLWKHFRVHFMSTFRDLSEPVTSTLMFVLRHTLQHSGLPTRLVYLAIDEIQNIVPAIQVIGYQDHGAARNTLTDLVTLSRKTMSYGGTLFSTIVHMGGLSETPSDIILSTYIGRTTSMLPTLVSPEAIMEAFDGANHLGEGPPNEKDQVSSWDPRCPVRLALSMVGGHFRSLEFLCRAFGLLQCRPQPSNARTVYLDEQSSPTGWFIFVRDSRTFLSEISLSVFCTSQLATSAMFHRGDYFDNSELKNIPFLQREGIVEAPFGQTRFEITPLFLYLLCLKAHLKVFDHMAPYINGDQAVWHCWERINTAHIGARLYLCPYDLKTPSNLFPGTWGRKKTEGVKVAFDTVLMLSKSSLCPYFLPTRWPPKAPKPEPGTCKPSAASSLHGMAMSRLPVPGLSVTPSSYIQPDLLKTPVMTAPGSAVDAFQFTGNALLLFQFKHTEVGAKMSLRAVLKEYEKVQGFMEQFADSWLLIIITNKKVTSLSSELIPENCCVLGAEHLPDYWGPFAPLAHHLPTSKPAVRRRKKKSGPSGDDSSN